MTRCKYCGQEILWMPLAVGKPVACQPGIVPYWKDFRGTETVITDEGERVRCWLDGEPEKITGVGHELHRTHCSVSWQSGRKLDAE